MTAAVASRGCGRFVERRERLVDAAAALFRQKGYAATSVQDLADAVGMHKSTVFHYFDCKDDLLFCIVQEVCVAVDGIGRRARTSKAAPLDRVTDYVRRFIDLGTTESAKFAVYRDDVDQLTPGRLQAVERHLDDQRRVVGTLLVDARCRCATPRDAEADLLAAMLIDAARGLSAAGSRGRRTASADTMTEFLLLGLLGSGATTSRRSTAGVA